MDIIFTNGGRKNLQKKFEIVTDIQEQYAIEINNISKSFNFSYERVYTLFESVLNFIKRRKISSNKLEVLKNISFNIKKGEVIGIIGRNGAGKTTLLKLLTRIIYPDSGVIKTRGKISAFLELGTGFNPDFNAEENVILYGTLLRLSRDKMVNKMDDILEFAELKKFRHMKLRNFSSGMILRLAFATAINVNPDILIIDEVLAVGDEAYQRKCMIEMKRIKNEGKTIILVTHNLPLVKEFCDKAFLLDDGRIIAQGSSEIVINSYHALISGQKQLKGSQETQRLPFSRRGTLDITIEKIRLLNNELQEINLVDTGTFTIVQLEIKFNKDIEKPVIGLIFKTGEGAYLYGMNTFWKKIDTKTYKKGDQIIVNFRQNIWLNQGRYTLTPYLAHEGADLFYDWQDNALIFNVEIKEIFHGVVNLDSEIEILKV